MISRKERIFWILMILITIPVTFLFTKTLTLDNPIRNLPIAHSNPSPTTEIEKTSKDWFTSTHKDFLNREQFKSYENKGVFQNGILDPASQKEESWTKSPEGIALLFFGYNLEFDGNAPDELKEFYAKDNSNEYGNNPDIVTVIIKKVGYAHLRETRIDLIKINNKWKIVWAGERYISRN